VLDYKSAYDEPYLKGKTKWLSENESKLSPAEVNVAKTEIKIHADWVQMGNASAIDDLCPI